MKLISAPRLDALADGRHVITKNKKESKLEFRGEQTDGNAFYMEYVQTSGE